MIIRPVARLHVIVNVAQDDDGTDIATAALGAGANWIQIRAKDPSDRRRLELSEPLMLLCRQHRATCIVNDRADIAIAIGADGVHAGADDLPVSTMRRLLGPDGIIGGTARDPETARRLQDEGATYLGVGPIYNTHTKRGLPPALGPHMVERIASVTSIPVIAIAGITVANIPELTDAGAHGVAVIGAIANAKDPREATSQLLSVLCAVEVAS